MKMTFVAEINKLKNIQNNLEKSEQILLEHIGKYVDSKVVEYYKELEQSRNKELEILHNDIRNIYGPLNKIKCLISESDIEAIDVKQLKKEMLLIRDNLEYMNEKTKSNLAILQNSEKELTEEIKVYEQKMQEWGKSANVTQSTFTSNNFNKVDRDVADFLTFLSSNGGHENGWAVDDHNLFLKIRAKCKSVNEICQYLHAILPDISEEDIITHEKWYIKYLNLKSKHKQAIKNWRQTKSAAKIKVERKVDENRAVSAIIKPEILNRDEIQQKLQAWRQEKKEKLESANDVKIQFELHRKELEEKRKQKQNDMKKVVHNWKFEKIEQKYVEQLEKQTAEQQQREFKSAMANRLIKEFQTQDDLYIQRKKEISKPRVKSMERLNSSVVAPRDPSRLLKPTKQWILRTKRVENENKINVISNIRCVPKLGIPEWRRQLQ